MLWWHLCATALRAALAVPGEKHACAPKWAPDSLSQPRFLPPPEMFLAQRRTLRPSVNRCNQLRAHCAACSAVLRHCPCVVLTNTPGGDGDVHLLLQLPGEKPSKAPGASSRGKAVDVYLVAEWESLNLFFFKLSSILLL